MRKKNRCALLVGLVWAMGVSAQISMSPLESFTRFNCVSGGVTSDGKYLLVDYKVSDTGLGTFTLYDDNFNVVRSFSVQGATVPEWRSAVRKREGVMTVESVDTTLYWRNDEISDWSENGVFEFLKEFSGGEIVKEVDENNETIFVKYYYYESEYGHAYPIDYYIVKEQKLYSLHRNYKIRYIGDWKTDESNTEVSWYGAFDDLNLYDWCSPYGACDIDLFVSQTFFNADDKFEVLRPVVTEVVSEHYKEDRDNDGEIDCERIYYKRERTGVEIVSEDGTVLGTIPCTSISGIYCFRWNGKSYLAMKNSDSESEYAGYDFYLITDEGTGIQKVNAQPLMNMFPRVAEKSSVVTVELGEEEVSQGGDLMVTDMGGRVVKRCAVPAGQRQVQLRTDRMAGGVYNVSFCRQGQPVDNGKIIVK